MMKKFYLYLSLLSACAYAGNEHYKKSLQEVVSSLFNTPKSDIPLPTFSFDKSLKDEQVLKLKKEAYNTTLKALELKSYIINLSELARNLHTGDLSEFLEEKAKKEFKEELLNTVTKIIDSSETENLDLTDLKKTKMHQIEQESVLKINSNIPNNDLSLYIEQEYLLIVNKFLSYTEEIKGKIDSAYSNSSEHIKKLIKNIETLSDTIQNKEQEISERKKNWEKNPSGQNRFGNKNLITAPKFTPNFDPSKKSTPNIFLFPKNSGKAGNNVLMTQNLSPNNQSKSSIPNNNLFATIKLPSNNPPKVFVPNDNKNKKEPYSDTLIKKADNYPQMNAQDLFPKDMGMVHEEGDVFNPKTKI
ncbi:hypothetical protein [Holospora undulata]|uniref:Lipoprotein n=1 Tax=Holospora undulata HU1 TaxID=1321371 RepID=A0A061JHV1_9PROT|nr:hypothetical protein [Holospora undulata]ETZ04998.1 hypothetical protein K737_300593 [Holospora undulata HU1]